MDEQPTLPTNSNNEPTVAESPAVVPPAAPVAPKNSNKKILGKIGIIPGIIGLAVFLVGGSAAAYFGVVVPNKPENVLRKAIENTASQTKSKFEGVFNYESTDPDASIKAVKVSFKGQTDSTNSAYQSEFDVTASGVKLPFEIRSVEKSLFVKVGDLSTVKSLAMANAPQYATIIDAANEKIANQWIEIDETLLKQAEADCALNTSLVLSKSDIELLQKRYQEVPFTTVKNTSSDKVNGRPAYKYEIELDDNKGAEYIKGLEELSVVKKLKECSKDSDALDTKELADDDITPITIWVDKRTKTLSKFVMNSTKQDEEKSNLKGSLEITFSFGEASITKPEGAKPAMEILADLQKLLYSGFQVNDSSVEGAFDVQDLGNFDF